MEDCKQAAQAPSVSVIFLPMPEPSVESKVPIKEATGLVHGNKDLTKKAVLGYTQAVRYVEYSQALHYVKSERDKWVCGGSVLNMTLGYSAMNVQIAPEFPEDSCAYRVVREHEQEHVKAYQSFFKDFQQRVKQRLEAELADRSFASSEAELEAIEGERMQSRYLRIVHEEFDQAYALHKQIDNEQEEARIRESCNGEVVALLKKVIVGQK